MAEPEKDPYELLGLQPESTVEQIRKAYRMTSLKVHPDKNPSPEASSLFHALTQAYNALLDPQKRAELDSSLHAKRARAAQLAAASGKKRVMLEELEKAERAAKRTKLDSVAEEQKRRREEDAIKAEGRRRREEAERRAMHAAERAKEAVAGAGAEKLGPMDLTLLLRLPYPPPTTAELAASLGKLGHLDPSSILIRPPKPPKDGKKEGKKKGGTAVVQFLTKKGALAASQAGGRRDLGLEGVRVEWAAGEPEWVKKALAEPPKPPESSALPSFDMGAAGLDYESVTLARMRKMERERLEREIREQEGE